MVFNCSRVRELENQVYELESEASRLSRGLDASKVAAQEFEIIATRRAEDLTKELNNERSQVSQLKQKLQSYSDYDEIKRELEIMKVCYETSVQLHVR
jgi:homeobox protein cut-like